MSADLHVPQFRSCIDRTDYEALAEVFEGSYVAEGPIAARFRAQLLDIIGAPHGVFTPNGTLALYLALRGLGVGPGDEVLVQDITFIASANAVEMVGATPIFVDVPDYNDLTIDLDRVTIGSRTKAVVLAHLFGTACSNTEEVAAFCVEHGLLLVEDAAQALSVQGGTRHCGTFGHAGTFSFYADKTITTGEGGFVVTDDGDLHERMMLLRNQGRRSSGTFVHEALGYNLRITDIQAALGISQLRKLDTIVKRKQDIAARYETALGDDVTFVRVRDDFRYIPFRVVVFVNDAQAVMEKMRNQNIEPRSIFYPLHRQPCYAHLASSSAAFPCADEAYRRGVCLPTFVGMTDEQVDRTAEVLLEAVRD